MSILSTLKVSTAKRAPGTSDAVANARSKVLAALTEQRKALDAAIKGEMFTAVRGKGEKAKEKKFRPWYFKQGSVFLTEVRYGVSSLDVGGGTSIEAGAKLEDVAKVWDVVEKAINAGELDEQLKAASAKRGRKGKAAAPAVATSKPKPSK